MSYADIPRPCSCFNGYCYRSLCAERVVEKQRKAEKRHEERKQTSVTKSKQPEILVRRWEKVDGD